MSFPSISKKKSLYLVLTLQVPLVQMNPTIWQESKIRYISSSKTPKNQRRKIYGHIRTVHGSTSSNFLVNSNTVPWSQWGMGWEVKLRCYDPQSNSFEKLLKSRMIFLVVIQMVIITSLKKKPFWSVVWRAWPELVLEAINFHNTTTC